MILLTIMLDYCSIYFTYYVEVQLGFKYLITYF